MELNFYLSKPTCISIKGCLLVVFWVFTIHEKLSMIDTALYRLTNLIALNSTISKI